MRDAHRGRSEHLLVAERERTRQGLLQILGDAFRVSWGGYVLHQDGKLVAAEPGDRIAEFQALFEPPRRGDDHVVAMDMAKTFVDKLKSIEIEIDHRKTGGRVADPSRQGPAHALQKHDAVCESGQRVVQGVMDRLLLCVLAVGDIGLRARNPMCGSVSAPHGKSTHQHPAMIIVRVAHPVFDLEMRDRPAEMRIEHASHAVDIVGMDSAEPFVDGIADIGLFVTEHLFPAAGIEDLVAFQVPVPKAVIGAGRGKRIAFLAFAQPAGGEACRRHVAVGRDETATGQWIDPDFRYHARCGFLIETDRAAVETLLHGAFGDGAGFSGSEVAARRDVAEDVAQRRADLGETMRQIQQFEVSPVPGHQPKLGVDCDKRLRNVFQSPAQQGVALFGAVTLSHMGGNVAQEDNNGTIFGVRDPPLYPAAPRLRLLQ